MNIRPDGITRYHESPSPMLSVLICTIPQRAEMLAHLLAKFDAQEHPAVEVVVGSDRCVMSIGAKRQWLLENAEGKYVTFIDDDDMVADDYSASIVAAAASDADVITFKQSATVNRQTPFLVTCRLHTRFNEQQCGSRPINRPPWHWCCWKRSVAILHCDEKGIRPEYLPL